MKKATATFKIFSILLFLFLHIPPSAKSAQKSDFANLELIYEEWNQILRITFSGKIDDLLSSVQIPSPINFHSLKGKEKIAVLFKQSLGLQKIQMGSYPCEWEEPGGYIDREKFILRVSAICKEEANFIEYKLGFLSNKNSHANVYYRAYFNNQDFDQGVLNYQNPNLNHPSYSFSNSVVHAREYLGLSPTSFKDKLFGNQDLSVTLQILVWLILLIGVSSYRIFIIYCSVFSFTFGLGYFNSGIGIGTEVTGFLTMSGAVLLVMIKKEWVPMLILGVLAFIFGASIPVTDPAYTKFPQLSGLQGLVFLNLLILAIAFYLMTFIHFNPSQQKKLPTIKSIALAILSIAILIA